MIILLLLLLSGWSADGYQLRMMAGGFGSPKFPAKSPGQKPTAAPAPSTPQYDITREGDGSTYVNHCPALDRGYPQMRCVNHDPPVFEIDHFLTDEICDSLIVRAQHEGVKVNSRTFSADYNTKRTSTTWYLTYESIAELLDPLNRLTGWSINQFEEPQVVRYEIGEQFSWHCDAIPKSLQDSSGTFVRSDLNHPACAVHARACLCRHETQYGRCRVSFI